MRLSQIRLLVDDPAKSCRFYRDVPGLTPSFGEEGDAYVSFRAGDGTVALFTRSGQADAVRLRPPGDGAVVVLEVDDLEEESRRLTAAGERSEGPVADQPDWGIRVLHVRDPDGNLVELVEPLPTPGP